MKRPDKRKLVNWEKKSNNDDERISKRLDGRALLVNEATTKNDAKPKIISPITTKAPAVKVLKKIKEAYDEEDEDEEDSVYAPFFDISLIEDDEQERKEDKKEQETLAITKEQQLVSKLNIIMNTAIDAEEAGLSGKLTQKDLNRINDAEYNPDKLERKTIKEKIEKPLNLKGDIDKKDPRSTLESLKKLAKELPDDALEGLLIQDIPEIEQATNQEEMAKLILEKSGRLKPKKDLLEIATESENIKRVLTNSNEKE